MGGGLDRSGEAIMGLRRRDGRILDSNACQGAQLDAKTC